jgi:hypothetical protein
MLQHHGTQQNGGIQRTGDGTLEDVVNDIWQRGTFFSHSIPSKGGEGNDRTDMPRLVESLMGPTHRARHIQKDHRVHFDATVVRLKLQLHELWMDREGGDLARVAHARVLGVGPEEVALGGVGEVDRFGAVFAHMGIPHL